ncbi:cysteine-rich receptor-like protein kinase 44 [Solanum lycopersicum]|uniref:Protein kinase domain-containing protein n=1 Tax=Solanum lycopersicum TaxID=4081 RepID=A0A3Q7F6U1_SOLLC|nr:probable serine/threonine-protein kinase CST [Solanum lycopersicum]
MENVGSPSASDDGTPVQPISSSTPPVPSFPALLGTTVSGLSSSTADVETTPQVAGCGLSSSMAEVQSTPSTSQFAGSGLPSSLSMSGGGLSSSTVDGESAPSTSQVAGSGLSSSTQPQADEAAVSSVSNPEEFGPMQSHVIKAEAGEEKDLKLESEINYLVLKRKLVKFTIKQINSFISARSVVGIGSWGTVYEGMIEGLSGLSSDLNGERIAVKVGNYFCKEEEFCNDENYIQWKTEIMILSDIKHEGVIKLFGVCRTNRGLYLVYPFYERGDLQKSIEVLDWERALNVIVKVAEALRVLHRGQVVCRGLKPADILLDDNWNPVVTGFGLMKMFGDGLSVSQKFNQEDLLFSGHQDHVLHYDSYCLGFLMLQVLMKVKEAHSHWAKGEGNYAL